MKYKLILFFVILIAAVLRLWQLGNIPVSLDWDEAALGYNAYSILQTGRDEYGEFLPLTIRSFGDFKPALYVYFIIPLIALFGLSDIAVRLPSALLGITAVIATYFLVKEFLSLRFLKVKNKSDDSPLVGKWAAITPIVAAGLLAISPWHIQFSRVAFEANAAVTFNILGFLFFFAGLRKNKLFPLSVVFLGSALYLYQSEKLFVPLMVILLLTLFWKKILSSVSRPVLILTVVIGAIIVFPFVSSTLTNPDSLSRARGVSVFAREYPQVQEAYARTAQNRMQGDYLGIIFNNARVVHTKIIIGNYLAHFNPNWLFVTGDTIERHHAPSMGNLYIWTLPFILIGIYTLLLSGISRSIKLFIFGWFLLVPVPAAVTWDVPSSVRTLNFLPLFQIFGAVGLVQTFLFISRYKVSGMKYQVLSPLLYTLFFILTTVSGAYYLNQYFSQYNHFSSQEWQYGYKQVVEYTEKNKHRYDKIVVADQSPLDQSYIFFLYHLQYPPKKYHEDVKKYLEGGYREFDSYVFKPIEYERSEGNVLHVGRTQDFLESVLPVYIVEYLNGEVAVKMVE